jgi:hypothetical protein
LIIWHIFQRFFENKAYSKNMDKSRESYGRGGARPGAGRKKTDDPRERITVPKSLVEGVREDLAADGYKLRHALREHEPITLDQFDQTPTYDWDVSRMWPNDHGGLTATKHIPLYDAEATAYREQIKGLVREGVLKQGVYVENGEFSTQVFFELQGWEGGMVGIHIDASPNEFNFSSLRRYIDEHIVESSDATGRQLMGALIAHQSDMDSIVIACQGKQVLITLLPTPETPLIYGGGATRKQMAINFDDEASAAYVENCAAQIVRRSSEYMDRVNLQWGLGKYRGKRMRKAAGESDDV